MLKLERLSKYYTSNDQVVKALDGINLTFNQGEFVVITGESGSGKSTLLNVISGLDSFEDGELYFNNEETSYYDTEDWEDYRKKNIGFIFQRFNIIDSYTVYDNVRLALKLSNYPKDQQKQRALELIEAVGLTPQAKQKSSKLSGGQKQRVAIARALAKDAPIIVADEPTGNLDQETSKKILALLKAVAQDKLVILVTHNAEEVKSIATRTIRIFDGKIQEDKTLKNTSTSAFKVNDEALKTDAKTLLSVAFKNLTSMPKRTLLVGLISIFIVAVFMLSYGSYVDQSNTPGFNFHPIFRNRSAHRLIVTKADGSPLNSTDIQNFNQMSDVKSVISFDPVLDLFLMARNPKDPQFNQPYTLMDAKAITTRSLSTGRLPENPFEIVLPDVSGFGRFGESYQVGDVVEMYLSTQQFGLSSTKERTDTFTVVGLHSVRENTWPETAFVHTSFLNHPLTQHQAMASVHQTSFSQDETFLFNLDRNFNLFLDDGLPEDAIYINGIEADGRIIPTYFPELTRAELLRLTFTIESSHAFNPTIKQSDFTFTGALSNPAIDERYSSASLIIAHPSAWARFLDPEIYQMSLIVEDTFAARSVASNLSNQYQTLYPADYQEPFEAIFSVIGNILQIFSTVFIMIVMYLVSYLALKNVMKSRQKDYVIMRSIGASKKDLTLVTIVELMVMMGFAFIFVYGTLLGNQFFDFGLPNYLRFYTLSNYLFAFSLLLILMFFLGLRFNKKIFTQTVQTALGGE